MDLQRFCERKEELRKAKYRWKKLNPHYRPGDPKSKKWLYGYDKPNRNQSVRKERSNVTYGEKHTLDITLYRKTTNPDIMSDEYSVYMSNQDPKKLPRVNKQSVETIRIANSLLQPTYGVYNVSSTEYSDMNFYEKMLMSYITSDYKGLNNYLRYDRSSYSSYYSDSVYFKQLIMKNTTKYPITLRRVIAPPSKDDTPLNYESVESIRQQVEEGESYTERGYTSTSKLSPIDMWREIDLTKYDPSELVFMDLDVQEGVGYLDVNQSVTNDRPNEHEVILQAELRHIYQGEYEQKVEGHIFKIRKYQVGSKE